MTNDSDNKISVDNRANDNVTITRPGCLSRPYDHTCRFIQTAHFQSVKSDDEPNTWVKPQYYDDQMVT